MAGNGRKLRDTCEREKKFVKCVRFTVEIELLLVFYVAHFSFCEPFLCFTYPWLLRKTSKLVKINEPFTAIIMWLLEDLSRIGGLFIDSIIWALMASMSLFMFWASNTSCNHLLFTPFNAPLRVRHGVINASSPYLETEQMFTREMMSFVHPHWGQTQKINKKS